MSYIDNIRTFTRVHELGSMSAAARDLRISPAVASARIGQLETHLGVRLFQRSTRSLKPTEQGRLFYEGACKVIDALDAAEAAVMDVTQSPRGTLFVAAPLGAGRRFIAPIVPEFKSTYPDIDVRLRLSDRRIDLTAEGIDLALFLGVPEDSTLKLKKIADCPRGLFAAPDYIAAHGHPKTGQQLIEAKHACLNLRFPGAPEYRWTLMTPEGPERFSITGPFESDDGDVLMDWALAGHGIVMKPVFEVSDHLAAGRLVPVAEDTPPLPAKLGFLYAHRRLQDPKTRLFMEFASARIADQLPR